MTPKHPINMPIDLSKPERNDMQTTTKLQMEQSRALNVICAAVSAQIEAEINSTSQALRASSRSFLARQVQKLPSNPTTSLFDAALRDLPVASRALALVSASLALSHVRDSIFLEAVRYADIAMVLLGMPDAKTLLRLVEHITTHRCLEERPTKIQGNLATVRVTDVPLDLHHLANPCLSVEADQFSLAAFQEVFQHDQPVIIRACAAEWPATRKWADAAYLASVHGHRTVPVEWTQTTKGPMEERFCRLGEVLEMMLRQSGDATETVYLAQHPLFNYIPQLEADIKHPQYMQVVGKTHADLVNVWMGTAGSGSKLHYDSADNLLVQLVGEKKVVLVPAEQSDMLYRESRTDNVSPIDLEKLDKAKFPLLEKVTGVTAILRPGDALYIPATHWHWVKALSASISVNFWF